MTNPRGAGKPRHSFAYGQQLLLLLLAVTALAAAHHARADTSQPDAKPVEFNIPAQFVPAALSEFARQARVQLFFISDGFESIQANAVVGSYPAQQALDLLLAGTGLAASISSDSGVKVRPVSASMKSLLLGSQSMVAAGEGANSTDEWNVAEQENTLSMKTSQRASSAMQELSDDLEEIVVTGTSIRGLIPESTPLEIYSAVDIRNTGALTIEQFISVLPQNNNTLSEIGSGASSRETNDDAGSSVDLRGLGVGTTLVLLNGRRMAPSSSGRAADLSFIPIATVERVEVLTDGASAIYGADAIGGVVNFVLKNQQDGAETAVTVGGASGGNEVFRIDQSFGLNWSDGNALIAMSYMDKNDLGADERDYARRAAPLTLVPRDTRKNVLVTGSQQLPADVSISGDLLYSTRAPRTVLTQSFAQRTLERSIDHQQTVLNLEIGRPIGHIQNAALLFTYAEASSDQHSIRTELATGSSGPSFRTEDTTTVDLTAKLDGNLATIRSGGVLYALGAGYTEDEFDRFLDFTGVGGVTSTIALDRTTRYAFGELLVPIVSADQKIGGMQRLELILAARYTDYSDFGDNISRKIGILWSPLRSTIVRGTFGESFKAPFLFQLDPTSGTYVLFPQVAFGLPDIWTTDDSAIVLFAQGPGNPTLGPEEAETYTLGFDFNMSDLTISATYFNIEYSDRIAEPDPSGGFVVLASPQNFPELLELEPTLDQVKQLLSTSIPFNFTGIDTNDTDAVHAATTVFFDNRIRNLSVTDMDGLDFRVDYTMEMSAGKFSLGLQASKLFNFDERATRNAISTSRVDTVLYPSDLKARSYLGLQRERWNARLNINYVDGYTNPFSAANPRIDDWTTVDLLFSYQFPTDGRGLFGGMQVGLSIQNAFDEDPPFVAIGTTTNTALLEPIGFDPANANPIGRFVHLQFSKGW